MQTRSASYNKGFFFVGEFQLLKQSNDLNEVNCQSPIQQQFNMSFYDQGYSKEYQFCIQNFILSPNHQYLALNIQRIKIINDRFVQQRHFDYRVQIIVLKTNQCVFKGRFWCLDRLTMQFTMDSQFVVYSRADTIGIIDIKQQTEKFIKASASFYSLGKNNQINLIINKKNFAIYTLKNDNFNENVSIFKLFYFQKLFGFWKISSKFLIANTQTKTYLIYKKNKKILAQQKNINLYQKDIYIFQNKIIVLPQTIKKVYYIKQLRTGKIIRRINDFQLFQGNVFQNTNSIYLFAYLYKENAQEKYKFYLFDLLKGVKKELKKQFDQNFQIKYFPLIMQNDLIIGINEKGTLIRYFSLQD